MKPVENTDMIKWCTLDSHDGERTLKQHGFIEVERRTPFTHEPYNGNRALCNSKAGVLNENELFDAFENIEAEPQKDDCCVMCRKIAKTIYRQ